jgi:hypothetical protein
MQTPLRQWLILAALIAAIGLVHVGFQRSGHVWGDDFAEYLMHARNLALGQPYASIDYVYNPHYPQIGPPTYPPGCPMVLAPLYWLWGLNLTAFKLEMVFFFLAFLGAVYLCFRQELGFPKAAALVAILGLNHFFLKDTNTIGSDMPFLALLYLGIFLVKKADGTPPTSGQRWLYFALAGLVVYLSFSTRTLGALVIPAMWAQELISKRRISRPVLLATLVFASLAVLQSLFLHSDRHYLDQFNAGPMVLVHNAMGYLIRLTTFWHNGFLKVPSLGLFGLVTFLAVLGYVDRLRRRVTVCEAFAAIYLVVILLWPSYQGERYLYPIVPLYLFYAFGGLEHRWIAGRARLRRAVVATLALAIGLTYAARLAGSERGPLAEGVAKRESAELFDYVHRTTSDQDVLVFIKPRALALFTQRKASVYHQPDSDQKLWEYFRQIGATRLVVAENDEAFKNVEEPERLAFLRAFAKRNRERLESVYANRDFTVYKIK